jgi:subtilisin family serine protease
VIDEGFRHVDTNPAFDSMRNNGRLVDVRNFVYANSDVYNNSAHGTSSFSTMAGYAPGTYVGAAPEASYALYVTEYPPEEQEIELENMLAATERADSIGADIVTESLGYNLFTNPVYYPFVYADIDGRSSIAAQAANIATAKGMIFIASAGNEGGGGWNYILTPGDADSALTVGSVNEFKAPAGNSGYGPNSSYRRKPDVCMVGNAAAVLSSGVNAVFINGTSFATPQLAGWAACLWQSTPSANSYRIRKAIVESAHMYQTPDDHSGYGVPDFQRAREILNIDGPASDDILLIGPNPFSSAINLKLVADSGEMELALTAIDGRPVLTDTRTVNKGLHEISLSTANVPAGVYFLRTTNGSKRSITRMVKYH